MKVHNIKDMAGAILPYRCRYGSGIKDKNGTEIFDGDTLNIDFDAAQEAIGDGSIIRDILSRKFHPLAKLVVKFYHARFRLCWRVKNGGVETPFDLSDIDCIKDFVVVAND